MEKSIEVEKDEKYTGLQMYNQLFSNKEIKDLLFKRIKKINALGSEKWLGTDEVTVSKHKFKATLTIEILD